MKNWQNMLKKVKENQSWLLFVVSALVLLLFWWKGFRKKVQPIFFTVSGRGTKVYCLVTLLLLFLALGLWMFFLKGKRIRLERLFLVCALATGIAWLCTLPPLSAPDEITHYATAYKWSNQMLFQTSEDEQGYVLIRKEDADAPFDSLISYTKENYRAFFEHLLEFCRDSEMVSFNYKAMRGGPIPYIPQAVGITLGRVLHLGWAGTMLLGRLGNLLFFIVCIYWAIKQIPFGKMILFVVSLLPMTQELVSSMSYDVVVFSLTVLFTAVCFRDIYVKEQMEKRDVAVLTVLLMALVPCKIVYVLMVGLCMMIPKEKFRTKRWYLLSLGTILLLSAASLLINNMAVLAEYTGGGENYIGWADAPGYTIGTLLAAPHYTWDIFLDTIYLRTGFYWDTMIGKYLGGLNLSLDSFFVLSFSGLLFVAALKQEEAEALTSGRRAWCLVICAGISGLVFLSMLLGWTPVGSPFIQGIQGRYFLPILPLLLLTLRNKTFFIGGRCVSDGGIDRRIALAAIILNVFALHGAAAALLEGAVM